MLYKRRQTLMESLLNALEADGVDVYTTIRRFMGNHEIYLKFLYRFPHERPYFELKEKIEREEYDENFRAVTHSLKGLTYNLGMNKIGDLSAEISKLVREENFSEIPVLFAELTKNYDSICDSIHRFSFEEEGK